MGMDRIAMLKYGIDDLRPFENDIRFGPFTPFAKRHENSAGFRPLTGPGLDPGLVSSAGFHGAASKALIDRRRPNFDIDVTSNRPAARIITASHASWPLIFV
jgi:hypothetical protein